MKKIFELIGDCAVLPSIYPNEELVRKYILNFLSEKGLDFKQDKIGNVYVNYSKPTDFLLSAHIDKIGNPAYTEKANYIQGRLDNAIGIGIILSLLEKLKISAIFTVGEEVGMLGANFALKHNLIPDIKYIIIIDTSPFKSPKEGPIFYHVYSQIYPDNDFITKIYTTAQNLNINLQAMPGAINDGKVFVRHINNTVAFEPHINNYHTSQEICYKEDILNTYKIVKALVEEKSD